MYKRPISINDLLNQVESTDTPLELSTPDKKRKVNKRVELLSASPQSQVIVAPQQLNLTTASTPSLNTSMIPVNHSYDTGFQQIIPDRQAAKVAKYTVAAPTPTGIVGQPKFTPASIFNAFLSPSQPPMVIQQPKPHTETRKVSESVSTAPLQRHKPAMPVNVNGSLPVKEIEINGRHRFSNALMNLTPEVQQTLQKNVSYFLSQGPQLETTASQPSHTNTTTTHHEISHVRARMHPQTLTTQTSVNESLPVKEIEINGRHRFTNALMSLTPEVQQKLQNQAHRFLSQEQQAQKSAHQQSKKKRSTHDKIPSERAQLHPRVTPTPASVNRSLPVKETKISGKHQFSHIVSSLNPKAQQTLQDQAKCLLPRQQPSEISALLGISMESVSMPPVYETTTSHIAVPADTEQPVHHPIIIQQPIVTQTRNTTAPTVSLIPDEYYYPCEPLQIPSKELKRFSVTMPGGHEKHYVEYPLANGDFKELPVFKGDAYHMNKLLLLTGDVISFEQLLTLDTDNEKRKLKYTISGIDGQRVQVYKRNQLVKIKKQGEFYYPTNPVTLVASDVTVLDKQDGELINHYVEHHVPDQTAPIKIPVYDAGKANDNRLMFSEEEGVTLAQLQTLFTDIEDKKYFVMKDGQWQEVFKHYKLRKDSMLTYQRNARELKKETKASMILSSMFNQSQSQTQTAETTVQTMTPTQK